MWTLLTISQNYLHRMANRLISLEFVQIVLGKRVNGL